jgi:predicted RNA-binding protein
MDFTLQSIKEGIDMCEASAYVIDGDNQELIMEAVDSVEPEDGGYKLVNIFGEQKFIKGTIQSLSLVEHKIFLKKAS